VRTLGTFPDVEVVGITDVDPARAAAFGVEFGVPPLADLAALLGQRPDAVYVCVPPFAHGDLELTVAAAGVHLFVEKPLGLGVTAAERVLASVEGAGIVTAVGHHWRSSAAVQRAREMLADRTVRMVCASWMDKVPPVPWWSHRAGSGGQVVEQVTHVLDLARLLVGEVSEVRAFGDGAPPGPQADVDSATVGMLRFAGGAVGTVAATCRLGWKQKAGLELYADGLALTVTEDGLAGRTVQGPFGFDVDPGAARTAVDRAFVDAVRGRDTEGDGVIVDYAEALRTHRLACALADAAAGAEL
jgi:predicted dehydrogenase